ncbi:MAG: hypothetical protein RDU25_03810 [Patescibacteria group bacterium]|nr:hypothetical protein [Patescibacteria group bacterium]
MEKCYIPETKDLFRDPVGIEALVLLEKSEAAGRTTIREVRLFPPGPPWQALDDLEDFLALLCTQFNPRVIEESYRDSSGKVVPGRAPSDIRSKSMLVKENVDSKYPCLRDACRRIEYGAVLDWRTSRQRGGRNCVIDGSAKVTDYVFLGDKVQLRHNSAVFGPVIIGDGQSFNDGSSNPDGNVGDGAVIGRNVSVQRSIVRAGARITSGTDVMYSVIGRNVIIDPNATILYERFDREKEITIHRFNGAEAEPFSTEHQRLGAFIGDGCKVGSVKLHPGVILLPGCEVPSRFGELLSGVYTPEFFK